MVTQVKVNQQTLRKNNVVSVYVSVGQRCSNVARIYRMLGLYDALQFSATGAAPSVIMAATAADPAGLQYLAPFSGVTICEKFRDAGRHSLIIYDDLSKQAVAYRQLSLLLRRPPGREAYGKAPRLVGGGKSEGRAWGKVIYEAWERVAHGDFGCGPKRAGPFPLPGDVFYLHSRLLERACMMSPARRWTEAP
eukprot:gene5496-767_t